MIEQLKKIANDLEFINMYDEADFIDKVAAVVIDFEQAKQKKDEVNKDNDINKEFVNIRDAKIISDFVLKHAQALKSIPNVIARTKRNLIERGLLRLTGKGKEYQNVDANMEVVNNILDLSRIDRISTMTQQTKNYITRNLFVLLRHAVKYLDTISMEAMTDFDRKIYDMVVEYERITGMVVEP